MTNLERYQSMSAKEFAKELSTVPLCDKVPYDWCEQHENCASCIVDFLNAEYKEAE